MPGTATLTFTINSFVDISTGITMTTLGTSSPPPSGSNTVAVTQSSGGANVAVAADGTISVTGGLASLVIDVAGTYNPVVLFFKPSPGTTVTSMSTYGPYIVTPNGANSTLSVFDRGSGGSMFEFYVLVRTPNNNYGLIDPRIIND